MARTLFLSYDGMTDPLGQSQVLPYLVGLSQHGFDITLVSFEKPIRFTTNHLHIESLCLNNRISWFPLQYSNRFGVFSAVLNLFLLRQLVRRLHNSHSFELVHCRSYITALIGQWMKSRYGVKFIFDMRGFWADERVDGEIWDLNNLFYRLIYNYFKKKEKEFIQESNHIITLTEQSRSIIYSWSGKNVQPTAITVIPCCVDLNHFNSNGISESDKLNLRYLLNISKSARVISYVGSIGTWYMLPEMLSFFVRWLLIYPDSIFLFISQDDPKTILREATLQGVSHDKIRINSTSRTEMPLYISISDCSLFFIKPVFSKIASSPTKQGEIMAMGVPVICNIGIGDTDMIIRAYNSGLLINQLIESAYDQAISVYHQAHFESSAIRKGAVHHFSLDEGIHRYKSVYERILSVP